MGELVKIAPISEPYVNIVWQVSDWCNFRCPYCSEHNWGGKNKNNIFESFAPRLKEIFAHYKKNKYENFKIFFSGGEPSFWPPLIQVMDLAEAELPRVKFAINTNLSREIKWWQENGQRFDDIVCSFHIEGADKEKFIQTYKMLQPDTNYLVARMMMQENRFDEVLEFASFFKKETVNYKIEYVPLFKELSNTTEPWDYKEKRMQEFLEAHGFERSNFTDPPARSKANTASKEIYLDGSEQVLNSNRLVAERKNFFTGWKCNIQESIFINAAGDVSFATCGLGARVGSLYKETFNISSLPVVCSKKQCHCGTDIAISKEKP